MSVTLYVSPLIGSEEGEYADQERALLEELNRRLGEAALPRYEDPISDDENNPYWSIMLDNALLMNLHVVIESLGRDEQFGGPLKHLLDPALDTIRYIPIDFAEPIRCPVEEDEVLFGSCPALAREIERVAVFMEIPLERFPIDESGDGSGREEEWSAVIEELEQQGARCTLIQWAPPSEQGARERIREFCRTTGISEEEFLANIGQTYGSLEEFLNEVTQANLTSEEKNAGVILALVNYYHGCKLAIEQQLALQIG